VSPSSPETEHRFDGPDCGFGGWCEREVGHIGPHAPYQPTLETTAAIEAQARHDALLALRETVEGLIQEAGGLCVVPDDFEDDSINICATHSEIMFGDTLTCEDDPRHLRAVLAAIDRQLGEG
jgi:hypothetical protein